MKTRVMALALAFTALAGCIGGDVVEGDGAWDESTADELSSRAGDRLLGAWTGQSGPFLGLVLTETRQGRGRHFFMDVDSGIRCVRAPCPSTSRVEGYFTAGALTLTITAVPAVTGPRPEHLGRFYYTLQRDTLTLSRSGRVVARLTRAASYCGSGEDCAEQGISPGVRCWGAWTCASNACVYRCGAPTCATIRCAAGTTCVEGEQGATCLSNCARVRCAAGTTCVADAEGTRCVPAGTPCGTTTCGEGLVCCNPLRGICTRPGMFCIQ